MYKKIIAVLIIVTTAGLVLQTSLTYTNTELYNWLDAYLEKRREQWFLPPPEGTRQTDVSGEVCPHVSPEALDEVMAKHPFFMKTYVPSRMVAPPADARMWAIMRPIAFHLSNQSLLIMLAPDDYCRASYRHVM